MADKKNITIYDIAREAEVSPATVSRILTGKVTVSPEKRERVLAIIERHHFRPNAMARALSDPHTRSIGLISADVGNSFYCSLLSECTSAAYERGYSITLFNTLSRPEMEDRAISRLLEQRVDAIILIGGRIDLDRQDPDFQALLRNTVSQVPVVAASRSPMAEIPGVAVDHEKSMELALRHLIAAGHREIGFVYTGARFYGTREKLDCFRRVMEESAYPVEEKWLIEVPDYDMKSGRLGAERLLRLRQKPTAVLCINDMVSVGFLKGLTDQGVRIPDQLSLISFDDTFVTDAASPSISSVAYDYRSFADRLMDTAIACIEGRTVSRAQLIVPVLSLKESSGVPRIF